MEWLYIARLSRRKGAVAMLETGPKNGFVSRALDVTQSVNADGNNGIDKLL